MKTIFSLVIVFLFCLSGAIAQIHPNTMRLFNQDKTAPIINVYDLKKGTLLKSINTGEIVTYTEFNADKSKLYALGKQYVHIIDANTLELQRIKLTPDKDTVMCNYTKHLAEMEVESNKMKEAIEAGQNVDPNAIANFKSSQDSLSTFIVPIGISKSGLAVYSRTCMALKGQIEYRIYDASKGWKKVNTIIGANMAYKDNQFYIPELDGSVTVLDALTGKEIKKLAGAFEPTALNEAKNYAAQSNTKVNPFINPWGKYFFTTLYINPSGGVLGTYSISIYDIAAGKIIYTEKTTNVGGLPAIIPVSGESTYTLFQKSEPKTEEPKLVLPPAPDFSKMTIKEIRNGDMDRASKEYTELTRKIQGEWQIKHNEWSNPNNFKVIILPDINSTQEIFSIEGSRFIAVDGDYIIAGKELSIEIYDIKTKQLLYTLYTI